MERSDSSVSKPESPPPLPPRRRRRRRCAAWACCAVVSAILLLALVVLVLALTVFKPRDPTTTLVSVAVGGVSPRVTFPVVRVQLNVTLDLDLLVHNPNRASFSHAAGAAEIFYRGTKVGDVAVAPGRIPARGSDHAYCRLTVEAERLAGDLGALVADVLGGRVAFESSARIPGRVRLLGFVKKHVVAVSDCRIVIGFPQLRLLEQQCRQKTEL